MSVQWALRARVFLKVKLISWTTPALLITDVKDLVRRALSTLLIDSVKVKGEKTLNAFVSVPISIVWALTSSLFFVENLTLLTFHALSYFRFKICLLKAL